MAINLEKMLRDLQTGDEDIKVLALGTLLQYDFTPLAPQRSTLVKIRTLLENSPDSFSGDLGFLYRQVLDKLRDSPLLVQSDADPDDAAPTEAPTAQSAPTAAFSAMPAPALSAVPAPQAPPSPPPQKVPTDKPKVAKTAQFALADIPKEGPLAPAIDKHAQAPLDISALRGSDGEAQVHTLLEIKRHNFKAAHGEVIDLLGRTQNERVIATCVSALAAIGNKDDVPRMRPYLSHADGRVRANTIDTIAKIGTPLQLLIFISPMTRDYNKRARHNALRALARLGRERIIQLLTALLKHPNVNLRGNAIYVLENFQGEDVNKVIKAALHDKSEFIQMEALNLLSRRRGPGIKELIAGCLQLPQHSVKNLAATILKEFDKAQMSARERVNLAGISENLDPEGPLPDLANLRSTDVEMQIATLKKVESQFVDDAHGYVTSMLQSAKNPRLLCAALQALAAIGGRSDFPQFQKFLANEDNNVKQAAIVGCSQVGAPRDILTWLTPVLRDEDRSVREIAMKVLMRFRPQVLLSHFQQLLKASNPPVRITGIYALCCFSGDAISKLLGTLTADGSAEIRFHLAKALRNRREPWSLMLLERLIGDADSGVSAEARRSVAHIKGEPEPVAPPETPQAEHKKESTQDSQEADKSVAKEAEAAPDVSEEDMLSKSFVGNLASLANLSATSTLSTLFGKLSAKKHSTLKELSELDKRQRQVYETMGAKVYELAERGNLKDKEYRNSMFVIRKYLKLRAERQKEGNSRKTGSFLASLLGGGDASSDDKDIEVTLKQQYVYLGKTAYRLHIENGQKVEELKEHYLDVEALEARIAELMKEEG